MRVQIVTLICDFVFSFIARASAVCRDIETESMPSLVAKITNKI